MLYSIGSKIDEYNHSQYHNKLDSTIRFVGWKNMKVVYQKSMDDFIVSIDRNSNDFKRKKIKEIREFVDKNLGFSSERKANDERTYLYISNKKVIGCIVVERIEHAFKVVVPKQQDKEISFEDMSVVVSKEKEPALIGVSRIWVYLPFRRNGIASTLLDVMRSDFVYGSIVAKNKMALSQPTSEGKRFGEKYFETVNFLVYEYED